MFRSKFDIVFEQAMSLILEENRKDKYIKQLQNKGFSDAEQIAQELFTINTPKKEACILSWILNGSVQWPADRQKAMDASDIIVKQNKDYQQYRSPDEVLSSKSSEKINRRREASRWDPTDELKQGGAFSNPRVLGKGIVVYDVADTKEGQIATRKAMDRDFGIDSSFGA